ncbi:hypothetical protein P8452_32315 [Trifolium repens]|nr:hypothetical protein P8452_32315 [Trifolium repens]
MGPKFIFGIILLHLLLIKSFYGSRGRELVETENKLMDKTEHKDHVHNHNHMDPSVMVFFTLKDLKVGKRMQIYFPKRDPSTSPKFWPRDKTDSLPFSLNKLQTLLKIFSFSQDSPQAKAMVDTLKECESKPIKGEVKFCATSLESMLDFTQNILGSKNDLKVYATSHLTKSSVTFQNYTIQENIIRISATKMVACHTMPYPYAVFYCHSQESENKIFRVSLVGDNGDKVEAIVVCHMDTSQWGHGHVSFKVLGVKPGSSNVCHFFPADNFIWISKLEGHGVSV